MDMVNEVITARTTALHAALRFALVAAIVIGLRLPTLHQTVIDWDESVYLVVTQDLVDGGELYRTVWDHKGPFLYAMLAPAVWIADGQTAPIRSSAILYLLITMYFVDLIGRRISSSDWSFVGALVYGLFFSVPRFGGLAANGELFMMLPATMAIWFALGWDPDDTRRWNLFACGFFAAVAVFTKTTAIFTVAVILLLVLVRAMSRDRPRRLAAAADLAAVAGPALVIAGSIFCWFWMTGRLPDYLFATFGFNRAYVAGTPLLEAWEHFAAFFAWAAVGDTLTALAVIGGIFLALVSPPVIRPLWIRTVVIGLSLLSLFGVVAARNLFFHYYLQMALPIAIVITLFAASLGIGAAVWRRVCWIALALGVVSAFSPHRFGSDGLTRKPAEDRVLAEVTAYIDEHAQEGDELYVLGGEPALYYLCQRSSPGKYFFWLYLTDRWDAILDSRKSTLETFAEDPPEWFIFAPHDLEVPEIESFMFTRYVLVHEVDAYQIAQLDAGPLATESR
jgi:4-amino-4-deoxy-L-arabinose transferase-like glycosyltransferase